MDFCVDVKETSNSVVIFYIDSLLQTLAKDCFRDEREVSSIDQALQFLHDPFDSKYHSFRVRAYDLLRRRYTGQYVI